MSSPQVLRVAALVEVLAPLTAVLFIFVGGAIPPLSCGRTVGSEGSCAQVDLVMPWIRTNEGMLVSLAICGLAWLVANYVVLAHLARSSRRRLLRLAAGIALVVVIMGTIGFFTGLQYRLLYAAQGAIAWGLAGLVLAWFIGVPLAGVLPPPADESPASRAGAEVG